MLIIEVKLMETTNETVKDRFNKTFELHLHNAHEVAKHLLKIGKNETSVLISHKVKIVDTVMSLETEITLLPIRRVYKLGDKLIDDDDLTFEMLEGDLA